jgi:hypothetical protein
LQQTRAHLVVVEIELADGFAADFVVAHRAYVSSFLLLEDPARSGHIVSCLSRGIDAYVPTPPDPKVLAATVQRLLVAAVGMTALQSLDAAERALEEKRREVAVLQAEMTALRAELSSSKAALDAAQAGAVQARALADATRARPSTMPSLPPISASVTGPLAKARPRTSSLDPDMLAFVRKPSGGDAVAAISGLDQPPVEDDLSATDRLLAGFVDDGSTGELIEVSDLSEMPSPALPAPAAAKATPAPLEFLEPPKAVPKASERPRRAAKKISALDEAPVIDDDRPTQVKKRPRSSASGRALKPDHAISVLPAAPIAEPKRQEKASGDGIRTEVRGALGSKKPPARKTDDEDLVIEID